MRSRRREAGIWLLALAWLAQQGQVPLHAHAMARQDPLRSAFCGLVSSPQTRLNLLAVAPPELLGALKRRGDLPGQTSSFCSLCQAGHASPAAGAPATTPLVLAAAVFIERIAPVSEVERAPWPRFQARGTPRV